MKPTTTASTTTTTPDPSAVDNSTGEPSQDDEEKLSTYKFAIAFAMEVEAVKARLGFMKREVARLAGVSYGSVTVRRLYAGSAVVEGEVANCTEQGAEALRAAVRSGHTSLVTVLGALADTFSMHKLTSDPALQQALAVLIVVAIAAASALAAIAIVCVAVRRGREAREAAARAAAMKAREDPRVEADANAFVISGGVLHFKGVPLSMLNSGINATSGVGADGGVYLHSSGSGDYAYSASFAPEGGAAFDGAREEECDRHQHTNNGTRAIGSLVNNSSHNAATAAAATAAPSEIVGGPLSAGCPDTGPSRVVMYTDAVIDKVRAANAVWGEMGFEDAEMGAPSAQPLRRGTVSFDTSLVPATQSPSAAVSLTGGGRPLVSSLRGGGGIASPQFLPMPQQYSPAQPATPRHHALAATVSFDPTAMMGSDDAEYLEAAPQRHSQCAAGGEGDVCTTCGGVIASFMDGAPSSSVPLGAAATASAPSPARCVCAYPLRPPQHCTAAAIEAARRRGRVLLSAAPNSGGERHSPQTSDNTVSAAPTLSDRGAGRGSISSGGSGNGGVPPSVWRIVPCNKADVAAANRAGSIGSIDSAGAVAAAIISSAHVGRPSQRGSVVSGSGGGDGGGGSSTLTPADMNDVLGCGAAPPALSIARRHSHHHSQPQPLLRPSTVVPRSPNAAHHQMYHI